MELLLTISSSLFALSVTGLLLYHKAYSNQKGENKALKEDVAGITKEKEEVKSKYDQKRYQYETKYNSYMKYFELIDIHNKLANDSIQTRFLPIITKFNDDYLKASQGQNSQAELDAISEFSTKVLNLTTEMNNESIRIRNETNSIKLIAPQNICDKIEELDTFLVKLFDKSMELVKLMGTIDFMRDKSIIVNVQEEAEQLGNKANLSRIEIRKLMRIDLGIE